jgi:hypothetical protein
MLLAFHFSVKEYSAIVHEDQQGARGYHKIISLLSVSEEMLGSPKF